MTHKANRNGPSPDELLSHARALIADSRHFLAEFRLQQERISQQHRSTLKEHFPNHPPSLIATLLEQVDISDQIAAHREGTRTLKHLRAELQRILVGC